LETFAEPGKIKGKVQGKRAREEEQPTMKSADNKFIRCP
jgi:hypothetical protein